MEPLESWYINVVDPGGSMWWNLVYPTCGSCSKWGIIVDPREFQWWILVDPGGSMWWILVDRCGGSLWIPEVDPGISHLWILVQVGDHSGSL